MVFGDITNMQKRLTICKPIKHILRFVKYQLPLYISIVKEWHEKTPNHFGWRFDVLTLVILFFLFSIDDVLPNVEALKRISN